VINQAQRVCEESSGELLLTTTHLKKKQPCDISSSNDSFCVMCLGGKAEKGSDLEKKITTQNLMVDWRQKGKLWVLSFQRLFSQFDG